MTPVLAHPIAIEVIPGSPVTCATFREYADIMLRADCNIDIVIPRDTEQIIVDAVNSERIHIADAVLAHEKKRFDKATRRDRIVFPCAEEIRKRLDI